MRAGNVPKRGEEIEYGFRFLADYSVRFVREFSRQFVDLTLDARDVTLYRLVHDGIVRELISTSLDCSHDDQFTSRQTRRTAAINAAGPSSAKTV